MKLIPKAKGGLSFNQAFAQAKKAGLKTFKWRGGTYGTQLASETEVPSKVFANTQNANNYNIPGFNKIIKQEKMKVNGKWKTVNRAYYQSKEFPGRTLTYDQAANVARNRGNFNGLEIGIVAHRTDIQNGKNRAQEDKATGYIPVVKDNEYRPSMNDYLNGFKPTEELAQKAAEAGQVTGTKNPVWQNYTTGEYYMTHPKTGQVMYSSSDEKVLQNPSLWTNYHTGLNGDQNQAWDSFDNNRGALIVAVDRNARGNQNVRIRQNAIDRNMLSNITQAQEKGARYLQMPATIVSHALWGAWNPANFDENGNYDWGAYWRGFGFKNGSNGFDWYGPNKDTVTGFGSRMAGLANLFGYDTTSPFAKSMIATGDVAGNAALAQLMTAGRSTTGTQKELQAYNVHGKGLSKNGFGFDKGKFGATTAGRPELTTTMQNMKVGDPRVTLPTKNGNVYVGLRPNGWQVAQSVSGFGAPIIKANVVPAYSNTTVTVPGSSGYPVGYSPKDNFSGFNPVDAPLRYAQSYSVNYEPTINNDPYRAQMIYDASKPVAGSAGKDVRQTGNVTVGTSNDTTNELRSRGRRASTSKRQSNKQSTGKTDQTQ